MMNNKCECGKNAKCECINESCKTCCHKKFKENNITKKCHIHMKIKDYCKCECGKTSSKICKYNKCRNCCNAIDCEIHLPKCDCNGECYEHSKKCDKRSIKKCTFYKCKTCCNDIDCEYHELKCKCKLMKKKKVENDCDNKQCDACCYDKDCEYHRENYVKKRDRIIEKYKTTKLDCNDREDLEIYKMYISKIIPIKELADEIFEYVDEIDKCCLCGDEWYEDGEKSFFSCYNCKDYFCENCDEKQEPFVLCDIMNCHYCMNGHCYNNHVVGPTYCTECYDHEIHGDTLDILCRGSSDSSDSDNN